MRAANVLLLICFSKKVFHVFLPANYQSPLLYLYAHKPLRMSTNSFITTVLLILTLQACKSKKASDSQTGANSGNYIVLPDTTAFDPSWSKENVVIVHTISEPDNLHPTNGTTAIRAEIQMYTQMSLIQTDMRVPGVRPALCKSIPVASADGLTFSFELRKEPRWDDGSPVSVEDIIFTVKANKCPQVQNAFAKSYWANVNDVLPDPSDPRRFKAMMKEAYIQNLAFWSDFPVMQRKFYDPSNVLSKYSMSRLDNDSTLLGDSILASWANGFNDAKYGFDPAFQNGLGMYKVEKWEPGQMIVLQKKKNHWTASSDDYYEKALPEKIIYKINRDANAQVLDFKSQAFDASAYISAKTLFDLKEDAVFNKNYHSRFVETFGYTYIAMNMRPDGNQRKKLFDDVRVRRAMALLTPVDDIIRVVNRGINKRISGPVSPLKTEYNKLPVIPLDAVKAIQLLNEAGWKDTDGDNILDKKIDGKKTNFEFEFNYLNTQVEWKDMASIICESYAKAGIKATAMSLEQSVMFGNAREHNFDMMLGSWATNSLMEDFTQVWHTQSWTSNGSNYGGFGTTESDSIIDKLKITLDASERAPMIKRFQQIVYDEQPFVFMYALVRRNILHKRLGNAELYNDRPGMLFNNLRVLNADEVTN
jgi:peptide/nickel transport system substrate-binding protein